MEPIAVHVSTTSALPRIIHLITQWYILYPLLIVFLYWAIFKRGKGGRK